MPITPKERQELADLFENHKAKYKGRMEDYFPLLYLPRKFGCEVTDVAQQTCFGNHDLGLDAYYIDRKAGNLYLFQFKWSEDHGQFKESMDRLLSDGLPQVFDMKALPNTKKADFLNLLSSDLQEVRGVIERVYIQFVFRGNIEAAENASGLQHRKEEIEGKEAMIRDFFKNPEVVLRVEYISDTRKPPAAPAEPHHRVSVQHHITHGSEDGRVLHVAFVKLMDLHDIYKRLGQKFLARNIRAALSEDNAPNRKIAESLRRIVLDEKELADHFTFLHNGVSLAAERVEVADGTATLTNPRLLNGAQTLSTLDRFLSKNADHPRVRLKESRIHDIKVLARMVVEDLNSTFVSAVTIANNQQNPVEPWNLRANDRIQCDLQDKLRDEVGIFYSRQENAFDNLSREEREDLGISDDTDLRMRPLAQTLLALQGKLDKITNQREVFETQKSYEETFKQAYLGADARKIVLVYKVGQVLNSPMKALEEKANSKLRPGIKRAKYVLWALLIQALLNSESLEGQLDSYGRDMTRQQDFRALLEDLTRRRVWNLIQAACNDQRYEVWIAEEKFNFLRTQSFYSRCMEIAAERWSWKKLGL